MRVPIFLQLIVGLFFFKYLRRQFVFVYPFNAAWLFSNEALWTRLTHTHTTTCLPPKARRFLLHCVISFSVHQCWWFGEWCLCSGLLPLRLSLPLSLTSFFPLLSHSPPPPPPLFSLEETGKPWQVCGPDYEVVTVFSELWDGRVFPRHQPERSVQAAERDAPVHHQTLQLHGRACEGTCASPVSSHP